MFKLILCSIAVLVVFVSGAPSGSVADDETDNDLATDAADAVPVFKALPVLKTLAVSHEPVIAKVGEVVESVPTAVSHQSSTIVHSRAEKSLPILAPAIISSNYAGPLATTPLLYQSPYQSLLDSRTHLPFSNEYYYSYYPGASFYGGPFDSGSYFPNYETRAFYIAPEFRK